jgi:hypothetical protein
MIGMDVLKWVKPYGPLKVGRSPVDARHGIRDLARERSVLVEHAKRSFGKDTF